MTLEIARSILKDIRYGKLIYDKASNKFLYTSPTTISMIYIIKTIKGDFFPILDYEKNNLCQKIDRIQGKLIAGECQNIQNDWVYVE